MILKRRPAGHSLIELVFTIALAITLAGLALPLLLSGLDTGRAASAAWYLAGRLRLARMEAVKRSAAVGLRFENQTTGYVYRMYMDGNGNGIRAADIASGVDSLLGGPYRLGDHFQGVTFGIVVGVPLIDSSIVADSSTDPVRIGSAKILTFTPIGTATPGTLYIRGRGIRQFAVRVLGSTARTRVMEFNDKERQWYTR